MRGDAPAPRRGGGLRATPKATRDVVAGSGALVGLSGRSGDADALRDARARLARWYLEFREACEAQRAAHEAEWVADAERDPRYPKQPKRQARYRAERSAHVIRRAQQRLEEWLAPVPLPEGAPGDVFASVTRSNRAELGCHLPGPHVAITITGDLETQARALVWLWELVRAIPAPPQGPPTRRAPRSSDGGSVA